MMCIQIEIIKSLSGDTSVSWKTEYVSPRVGNNLLIDRKFGYVYESF